MKQIQKESVKIKKYIGDVTLSELKEYCMEQNCKKCLIYPICENIFNNPTISMSSLNFNLVKKRIEV